MQPERRRHPRVKFQAQAVISINGAAVGSFEVQDLSASGAFLTGPHLEVGARILIELTSSPLRGARLEATVVRTQSLKSCEGIGVQFLPATGLIDGILQQTIIDEIKKSNLAAFIAAS